VLRFEAGSFSPIWVLNLDNQTLKKIREKQEYNKLIFKITQYGLRNRKPPVELIKEARALGCRIGMRESELQNIGS
jgi:hypothetical protein